MTSKDPLQSEEDKASDELFPELQEHLNYANDVYNLAFKVQQAFDDRLVSDISDVDRAWLMILMRITDFLRCTQLLTIRAYPEQAGTLATSVFELAHAAIFFSHSPHKAKVWLAAGSIKQEMPRGIRDTNWKKSVRANCKHLGDDKLTETEYQVYRQLCWMKHSLLRMQDMRTETDGLNLIFGPHTDERAINHAWFTLEHAGRLTECVISLLLVEYGNNETRKELQVITERRAALKRKAIKRFGQENPFSDST